MKNTLSDNIIVRDSKWTMADITTLFNDEEVYFTAQVLIPNLMVELGIFPSTSAARRANRVGNIPTGWTEFKASKKRKIWIWNPTE
jgi:hypothetical protein